MRNVIQHIDSYVIDKEVQALNYEEIDGLKYFEIDTYEILLWMVFNPDIFRMYLWTSEEWYYYKVFNRADYRWWTFKSKNPVQEGIQ